MKRWAILVGAATTLLLSAASSSHAGTVGLIRINGPIGPATASYIARAIEVSDQRGDACLILQLDTPGGLLVSTEEIVRHFYAAKLPVVVFVAPEGAHATSAGCFITLAADVAAMAPNTSIGAAHPVSAFGGNEEGTNSVMRQKGENFAASYIESIANKHKRNAEWARKAVIESAAATAEQALELKVIDLIAKDVPDLLKQLDAREVNERKLATAGAETMEIPMVAREKVLRVLLTPEIAFLLMLMVMYGVIGEISNPGAILPGVVGAIALILFLYMSAILPINVAGLVLIGLAVALFIVDIFAPTHGVLTAGGIVAFFLGALMLFKDAGTGFRLSLAYIIPATLLTAAFFVFIVGAGLRAQFRPAQVGVETMIGQTVNALSPIDAQGGRIFIEGELWNAISEAAIEAGQAVEVVGVEGLTLKVKPKP